MRDLLNELCALNGVSGDEGAVRDFIRAQAEPYADSIRTDALGNLIVFKRAKSPRATACFWPPIWTRWASLLPGLPRMAF